MTVIQGMRTYSILLVFILLIASCSKDDHSPSCDELRIFHDSTEFKGFMNFSCPQDLNKTFIVNGISHISIITNDSVSVQFDGTLDNMAFERHLILAVECDTLPGHQPFLRILATDDIASGSITHSIFSLDFNDPACDAPVRIWGSH
jgi:hypothetical protein